MVAGLLLAAGLAAPALAQNTFVFGFVSAVPSGTPVSGARVDAVSVVDFFGNPVFDITQESGIYSLFSVPSGERLLRVSGNCLDTTDAPVTGPPEGARRDIAVVNRSLPGVGDCLPFAPTPLFDPTFWDRQALNTARPWRTGSRSRCRCPSPSRSTARAIAGSG